MPHGLQAKVKDQGSAAKVAIYFHSLIVHLKTEFTFLLHSFRVASLPCSLFQRSNHNRVVLSQCAADLTHRNV